MPLYGRRKVKKLAKTVHEEEELCIASAWARAGRRYLKLAGYEPNGEIWRVNGSWRWAMAAGYRGVS